MRQGLQWKVLGVLLAAWVLLLAMRVMEDREPERRPLTFTSGQVVKAERPGNAPVLLALASPESGSLAVPRKPSKNIFAPLRFARPKPKKVAAKPEPPPPPKPEAPPPPPPGPSPEELAAAQARKQMAQYRVLGYSAEGAAPRAFLGKGNKIFIAQVGEELEDRIVVAAISAEAVKLRETRTKLEATLPMKAER